MRRLIGSEKQSEKCVVTPRGVKLHVGDTIVYNTSSGIYIKAKILNLHEDSSGRFRENALHVFIMEQSYNNKETIERYNNRGWFDDTSLIHITKE